MFSRILSLILAFFVLFLPVSPMLAGDLSDALSSTKERFDRNVQKNQTIRKQNAEEAARRAKESRKSNSVKCITINGDCTGMTCMIDKLTISGGPGYIDNSWSAPQICTDYEGNISGTYGYVMKTNSNRICSGSFQISSLVKSGVTINVYSDCALSYVNEY